MDSKKKKKTKADKLILAGDKLVSKKEYKKAFKKYREALKHDEERGELYDKLIETRDKLKEDWEMDDFVDSVSWEMKKQELSEPMIKYTHMKLTPEWDKANRTVIKLLLIKDDDKTLSKLINEMLGFGEIGTLALIDILRKGLKTRVQ